MPRAEAAARRVVLISHETQSRQHAVPDCNESGSMLLDGVSS
eukprot:CAMPEP_0116859438 /NCGR_PEP_ID=MMETSP0418-20121206/21810_1 /TAXON_ID=1158023 /ORGANISM="Astrosyne radiata, Strain 13vi08-1A" /LENGTH=41 /DNA_ID= /DNA_START= /DNA_END= /DNA_ORIENTATION=